MADEGEGALALCRDRLAGSGVDRALRVIKVCADSGASWEGRLDLSHLNFTGLMGWGLEGALGDAARANVRSVLAQEGLLAAAGHLACIVGWRSGGSPYCRFLHFVSYTIQHGTLVSLEFRKVFETAQKQPKPLNYYMLMFF